MRKYILYFLVIIFNISCGYPQPRMIDGTNEYELKYCDEEIQCFNAADKICPNGYIITKYGNIRPEKFKCK